MLGLYALNLLTVHVEQPDTTKVKAGCSMIEIYIICSPFKPQNEKKKKKIIFLYGTQLLTSCFSSSKSDLSIWSNNALHLAWCISATAILEHSAAESFETLELFSWLEGNSFDIRNGNSVWITARTLFLLRRNATIMEQNTWLKVQIDITYHLQLLVICQIRESLPARRPLMSWWRSSNHWEATVAAEKQRKIHISF